MDASPIMVSVVTEVVTELEKAMTKHPTGMRSNHEGYAVLREEVDELWDEIKKQKPCPPCIRKECIQVAAMALRFLIDLKPAKQEQPPISREEEAKALGIDPVAYADAFERAILINQPVILTKANGKKHYVMPPVETGNFEFGIGADPGEVTPGVGFAADMGEADAAQTMLSATPGTIARGPKPTPTELKAGEIPLRFRPHGPPDVDGDDFEQFPGYADHGG